MAKRVMFKDDDLVKTRVIRTEDYGIRRGVKNKMAPEPCLKKGILKTEKVSTPYKPPEFLTAPFPQPPKEPKPLTTVDNRLHLVHNPRLPSMDRCPAPRVSECKKNDTALPTIDAKQRETSASTAYSKTMPLPPINVKPETKGVSSSTCTSLPPVNTKQGPKQGSAKQGNSKQCNARQGNAKQSNDRQGNAKQANAKQGNTRQGDDESKGPKAKGISKSTCTSLPSVNTKQGKPKPGNTKQVNIKQSNAKQSYDDNTSRLSSSNNGKATYTLQLLHALYNNKCHF